MNSFVDLCTMIPIIFIKSVYEKDDEKLIISQLLNISRVIRIYRVIRYLDKNYKSVDSEVSNVRK